MTLTRMMTLFPFLFNKDLELNPLLALCSMVINPPYYTHSQHKTQGQSHVLQAACWRYLCILDVKISQPWTLGDAFMTAFLLEMSLLPECYKADLPFCRPLSQVVDVHCCRSTAKRQMTAKKQSCPKIYNWWIGSHRVGLLICYGITWLASIFKEI